MLAALDKISGQARRAGEVIQHLRQMVRQRSSARERVDLNELVTAIVPLAEVDARMHEVSIARELAGEPLPVIVDSIQIQQVVLNLLRNGMEAMASAAAGQRRIDIRTGRGADGNAEVAVKDRGSGVSKEAEEHLFHTFFTTKRSGMGMGLAISRSIAEAHGGRLWFTRNQAGGATFHLSLPAAEGGEDEQ
jgi:two-component system sensor histidine kinase TtrS